MKPKKDKAYELIRSFPDPAAWLAWLEKNHHNSPGLWLQLAKKGSGLKSVTYAEALEGHERIHEPRRSRRASNS